MLKYLERKKLNMGIIHHFDFDWIPHLEHRPAEPAFWYGGRLAEDHAAAANRRSVPRLRRSEGAAARTSDGTNF